MVVQVVCKSVWLVAFATPRLERRRAAAVPMGIAASFLFIVATYPFAILSLFRT